MRALLYFFFRRGRQRQHQLTTVAIGALVRVISAVVLSIANPARGDAAAVVAGEVVCQASSVEGCCYIRMLVRVRTVTGKGPLTWLRYKLEIVTAALGLRLIFDPKAMIPTLTRLIKLRSRDPSSQQSFVYLPQKDPSSSPEPQSLSPSHCQVLGMHLWLFSQWKSPVQQEII